MAWRKPANLREWLRILGRHKKKFFYPGLATMIGVLIASLWVPREYRAEAKFQRRNDVAMTELGDSMTDRQLRPIRRQIQEDMKGRLALSQLIDDLVASDQYVGRLWQFPRRPDGSLTQEGQFSKQDLITKLQARLNVNYQVQSEQIDQVVVSYTDGDRELAPRIVNRVTENYIKNTRDQLNAILRNAQKFFKGEVDRYAALVQELESKALRFELDNPGLAPDDPSSVQNKLVELRARRDRVVQELEVSKQRRIALAQFIKDQPESLKKKKSTDNPILKALLDRRKELADQLDQNVTELRRTESHPAVKQLRRRLAEIDKEIAATDSEGPEQFELEPNVQRISAMQDYEDLGGQLVALERQRDELNGQVEQFELKSRNFFPIRNEYLKLKNGLKDSQEQLKFWQEKLSTTNIALTAEVAQRGVRLSFIQHAPELARPSKPTLMGIGAASVILGLAVGGLIVLLAELLDRSFHSVEQAVDDLKLPVLGAVNEIVTPGRAFRRKLLTWGVFPSLTTLMLVVLGISFLVIFVNLQYPHRWDQFKVNPVSFVQQQFLSN